jgi:general secretion pathway protein G
MLMKSPRVRKRGFSLVELVIVIVIIGVIAAIAVPRISRGATGSSKVALIANLRLLRNAIEHYAAEHGGTYPSISPSSKFVDQLTTYTDADGNTSPTRTSKFMYGPYLVSVPDLKVGSGSGSGRGESKVGSAADASVGWVYDETTGTIIANAGTARDEGGKSFKDY